MRFADGPDEVPRIVQFVSALPKSRAGKVMWRMLQEAEKPTVLAGKG